MIGIPDFPPWDISNLLCNSVISGFQLPRVIQLARTGLLVPLGALMLMLISSLTLGFDRFSSPSRGAPPIDANEAPEIPKIAVPVVRDSPKVGRNDPCPCGNGKKYKKCCGRGVSA